MTDKQFWIKADQISESGKTIDEKSELIAALLKTAYDEDLKMVILYGNRGSDPIQHHLYMNLDDDHPNTFGNRCMLCYTSSRKAEKDIRGIMNGLKWGYAPVRDILNNVFNKAVIGSMIFNCYSKEWTIAVNKETLERYMPGPHPLPNDFVDVPVDGDPMLPQQ